MTETALIWTLAGACTVLAAAVVVLGIDEIRNRARWRALRPVGKTRRDPMLEREQAFRDGYRSGREEAFAEGREQGLRTGFLRGTRSHARLVETRFGIPVADQVPSAAEPAQDGHPCDRDDEAEIRRPSGPL